MQAYLFLDKISLCGMAALLYLRLRFRKLKVIVGTLPGRVFLCRRIEKYLMNRFDVVFVSYQHLDLHGVNLPEDLIDNFGELKDNINERSFLCCEELFKRRIAPQRSYKNILGFFNGEERVDSFIKKKLLAEYCRGPVCLFECANLLVGRAEKGAGFFFVLAGDSYNLWDIYKQEGFFKASPVLLFSKAGSFFCRLQGIAAGLAMPALIIGKTRVWKRLSFSSPQKALRKKDIWVAPGVNYNLLCNLFKETGSFNSRFSLQQALFIEEGGFDRQHMEKYRLEHNVERAVPEDIPIDIAYFCRRILWDICCCFIGREILFTCRGMFMWNVIFSLARVVINYECLCRSFSVKLFLLPRFYEPTNAIKTVIINKAGGLTVSLPFGEIDYPMFNIFMLAYCSVNHFFLLGEGLGEFQKCAPHVDKFHVAGSTRVDLAIQFKENVPALREEFGVDDSFVIVAFGPAYNQTAARKKNVLKFYRALYSAFCGVRERNIRLIIKPHKKSDMAEGEGDFPELAELLALFKAWPNVRYWYYANPYKLMAIAELCVTWSSSVTGVESIAAGKNTIYFDPMESRFHPYRGYHNELVISSGEDMRRLVNLAVDGKFPVPGDIYAGIINRHSYRGMEMATRRLLDGLSRIGDGVQL